jgi:hypothetical protein
MSAVRLFVIPLAALIGSWPVLAQDLPKVPASDREPTTTKEGPAAGIPDDARSLTNLKRVAENTFVHEGAQVSFKVPKDWKESPPHRLNRRIDPRIITVLGIERADREMVATIYWIPMTPDQNLSRWVRDNPVGGEYGEEYETLKTIYGKDHVTVPARLKSGPFDVYRINIVGGVSSPEKYDGTVFLFDVEGGGTTWLIKVRLSYPRGDKVKTDAWATEVLQGFTKMPASGKKAGDEK